MLAPSRARAIFFARNLGTAKKKLPNDGDATGFKEFSHPPLWESRAEASVRLSAKVSLL